jgi:2,3-diketo-5-methylthio-1-phosphopentane phosphatase
MLDLSAVRAVLLDIEGTTTPISFVFDVLFPYASRNVGRYLAAHYSDPKLQLAIQQLREKSDAENWKASAGESDIESLAAYARHLMSQDSKFSALKSLQGETWREGYASGELKGQVFDDVPDALRRWRKKGKCIYIYSSGSVLAQKLIFRHTSHGDLTTLLDGYFDTAVGAKSDPTSYRRIAAQIKADAAQILFISDVVRELNAAHSADMHAILSVRPGNPAAPTNEFESIRSFDELPF